MKDEEVAHEAMMKERRAQDEKRFEELRKHAVEQSLAASSSLLPAHLAQP